MGPRRGSWFPGSAGGGAAVALRPPRGLARRCPGPAGRAWGAPSSPGAAGRGAHHARGSRGRRLLGAQAAARPTSPRPAPRGSGRRSLGLTCAGFGVRPTPEAPCPAPGARRPERSAAARPRGLAGGPDGGAGAGRARAPREMPSRARCRLYLRSRLTSAARVSRARAPPWDLARPLRPQSPAPPRDALPRALPALTVPRAGLGWRDIYSSGGLNAPTTPKAGNPGPGCANIQTRAQTQALYTDTRSHHTDTHARTHYRYTRTLTRTHPLTPHGAWKHDSDPPRSPSSPSHQTHTQPGIGHRVVCAHTRGTGTHALDGDGWRSRA